jgi:glycosyltransferase involved in cell wall biosynthesis
VLFRSSYELELAVRTLGTRPTRTGFYTPLDRLVPLPPVAPVSPADTIAVWAENVEPALLDCALRTFFAVPLKPVVISSTPHPGRTTIAPGDASHALAQARTIVSIGDDPGTACALAAYGRPLCAATHGAAEMLTNVQTFDIWNPHSVVDAVLRSLNGTPPQLREGAQVRFSPPVPVKYEPQDPAPLVSIVITVYNRLESLRRTLADLQRQTYPNIEIVVVSNNGPHAGEICSGFPNVRYIHREQNSGAAAAPRNDGIAAARGTYITCLDDDDAYFPDHIERMVRICERGAKGVYGDFILQIVDTQPDAQEAVLGYDMERGEGITWYELLVANRIGYMTVFAHRSVYETLGAYDDVRMKGAEEVELWLRMARQFPLVHADIATSIYTVRKNWTGSLTSTDHFRYADGYDRMYAHYLAEGYPLVAEQRRKYVEWLRASSGEPPREPQYAASN